MKRWQITLVWARLLCVLLVSGAAVGQVPYTTTTSISASGSTGNYTLTGAVSGPGSSTVYPTGSLSFLDTTLGGASLGSAPLGAPVFSQSFVQEPSVTGSMTYVRPNAIGDFNGDRKGDYIVANFNASGYLTLTLYLSKGDGTFQSGTTVFTDTNISSGNVTVVVPGDFNKDGKLDVAVSVGGAATIVVLGNGDGTFQSTPSALLGAATNEVAMITGDFNGDGNLDIATVSGLTAAVYLGSGSGTFSNPKTMTISTNSVIGTYETVRSIVAGDFNGDGRQDLLVSFVSRLANNYGEMICLGNGDGSFQTCTFVDQSIATGTKAVVGDFNGDGHLDFALAGSAAPVWYGNGDGTFTEAGTEPSGTQDDVVVGDFNGDGLADYVGISQGSSFQVPVLTAFFGSTSRVFTTKTFTTTDSDTYQTISTGPMPLLVTGDINGDGAPDLAFYNGNKTATSVIVLDVITATSSATLTNVNPKGGGTHNVEAAFPAEANYKASTSGTVALTGTTIATSLNLSPNPTSSNYGQQVALTAVLNPYSYPTLSTNGEAISFYGNGTLLGTANLSSGVVTYQTTSLPIGTDSLTASFAADGNFAASSASSSITVSKITPTITLSAASTEVYGTGNVAAVHVSCNTSCGSVDYRFDGNDWGTVALDASGNFSAGRPATDPVGTHTIQVLYLGNGTYNPATSNTVTYSITKATPTISWATPAAITYGTALSSTQLSASAGGVSGTYAYSPAAGTVLGAGTQTLSVTFNPSDSTDYNSATGSVSLVVNKAATSISIGSTLNPTTYGQTVSWPFTVSTASGTIPPGDQIYYYTQTGLQFGTTVGGAPWGGPGLPAGTYSIYAVYQGDANYSASTSNTVTQVVNKVNIGMTITTNSPVTYGTPTVVNVAISCNSACGNLDFKWDGQEWGTVPLSSSGTYSAQRGNWDAAGTHTVEVDYLGDANDNAVNSTVQTITINKAPTISELSSSVNPLTAGATTTLSTLVDTGGAEPPTGTVTWTSNGTSIGSSSVSTVTTTNLVPNSNSFLSSTWAGYCGTPTNLTANTTAVAGPDGTATAWKIVTTGDVCHGASGAYGVVTAIPNAPTAGQSYVVSVWLRGASGGEAVAFGLTDCAEISVNVTTSWVRYSLVLPTIGANVSGCASGPRGFQMFEVHAGTVYFWGAQTEQASALGPYVATGNGAATGSGGVAQLATHGLVGGTDALVATYNGDSNDLGSTSPTVAEVVNKATPTITWATPAAITYGTALSATQLNASAGGIPGSFAYTPASGTILNVGTQTLSVTFTPTDTADYNTETVTVPLVVNLATPTITLSAASTEVYGTPNTATVHVSCNSACGAVGYKFDGADWGTVLLDSSGNYSATRPLGDTVGTHTIQVEYSGDSNDNAGMSNLVSYTITKATPTITWATPSAITYGTALSSTQLNASSGVAGSFAYSPASGTVLGGGTQPLSVTFTPTDTTDYNTASKAVSLVVNKVTPTITWSAPAAITYGTALSATQLNASSTTPGSFVYSPALGTVLAAGTQTLSVTFTPTDTSDYASATTTVPLTVNQAAAIIIWAPPSAITYGTPLTSTQLNANSGTSGTFTYSPIAGTVLERVS